MVSLWQVVIWIVLGSVAAAGAFCLVVGLTDLGDRPGLALLGAVALFGCLTIGLQIRILARLSRIDRRRNREGPR